MRPDFEKGNGLVPAIIQDYHTKEVLMLAYVNEEAYERMLKTKETYYRRPSRGRYTRPIGSVCRKPRSPLPSAASPAATS